MGYILNSNPIYTTLEIAAIVNFHVFKMLPVIYIILTEKRFILHDFLAFSGRYVYPDSIHDEDEEYYDICSKQIDRSIRTFFHKMTIILISAFFTIFWPSFQSFTHEDKITPFKLKIPYIKENSYSEFAANIFFEFIVLGHGFLGYVATEVGMDIVTDFIVISRKLLEYRLQKLFNRYMEKSCTDFETISTLRNIVENLRDFDEYNQIFNYLEESALIILN